MVKRSTSAGLAFLIVIVIGVLLLAPIASAIPTSSLALQEVELTATPPVVAADETAQPVETSQPQGDPPAAQGSDHGSVMFVENAGQWDEGARFQVWGGPAGTMWLAENAIWITVVEPTPPPAPPLGGEGSEVGERRPFLPEDEVGAVGGHGVNIKLSFVGANPQPRIETTDRLDTVVSYFLGNDPAQWRPAVPVWGGVRYVELYPGVDLELSGKHGQMMPRLAARAEADLGAVHLRVEGADAVTVDDDVLRLSTAAGQVTWPLLRVDGMEASDAQAEPNGIQTFNVIAPLAPKNFRRPEADENHRLPSDNPADLLFGTFLGSRDDDNGGAIVVDGVGNIYVTGGTSSTNFPTTPGAFETGLNGASDAFVAKLNQAGNDLVYATLLGGNGNEGAIGIAVDAAGSAYLTGATSGDFPTTPGAFDAVYNGGNDVFVAKLNATGSGLAYATYLGGNGREEGTGIALDEVGRAHVAGWTQSSTFPSTPGAFDQAYDGGTCGAPPNSYPCADAFITKLNPAGSELAYATFLGGGGDDRGKAIAIDEWGGAYVTGLTSSIDFSTTSGAFEPNYNGGSSDAFVVKLNVTGSELTYGSFLGGSAHDIGYGIAVDGASNAYVTGTTLSTNFPVTSGAFDTSHNNGYDAFTAKLNPIGSALAYSTFLGGNRDDQGSAISADGAGSAYVTGATSSFNFPTTPGSFDPTFNPSVRDAFLVKLNPVGSRLAYGTYLGGGGGDQGNAISVDGTGSAFVTGRTSSRDFPTTPGAFDTSYNYDDDAFVVALAMGGSSITATPTATPTRTPTPTPTRTPTKTPTPTPDAHYVPLVLQRWHPLPSPPVLDRITPPNATPRYTVRWTTANWATSYLLERATNASFTDATQVYAGTGTSTTVASQGIARYYYRVKARNQWGESPWSNVQSVEVRWEQEPNYPLGQANGPLISGLNYYGYPNDDNDYFYFQVGSRGQVTIDLTNHPGLGLQLLLRNSTGTQIAVANIPPYHLVITVNPGRYYVQLYATGNFNTTAPYTLRASFP